MIIKNRKENMARKIFKGENPHSKEEDFSRENFIFWLNIRIIANIDRHTKALNATKYNI